MWHHDDPNDPNRQDPDEPDRLCNGGRDIGAAQPPPLPYRAQPAA
jgi:hypothetical protein